MLEGVSDAVLAVDRDWRFTFANSAAERVLGRTRQQMLGRTLWEEFPEVATTAFGAAYQRALQEGVEVTVEDFFPPLSAWLEARAFPSSTGLLFVLRNVTVRRQTEDALRLRSRILESMAEGVSVSDAQGRIVYTNPAKDRMLGYGQGELLGQHVSLQDGYPPEERARRGQQVAAALAARGEWTGEWLEKRKDGTHFLIRLRLSRVLLGGQPHVVAVQEDITEAWRAREELQLLTDAVPVLIADLDPGFRNRFTNRTYEEWFGLAPGALVGHHVRELIGEESFVRIRARLEEALAGHTVHLETELAYPGHGPRWVQSTYTPRVGPRGEVEGLVVLVHDVSESRRAEQALRTSQAQATFLTRAMETLGARDTPLQQHLEKPASVG